MEFIKQKIEEINDNVDKMFYLHKENGNLRHELYLYIIEKYKSRFIFDLIIGEVKDQENSDILSQKYIILQNLLNFYVQKKFSNEMQEQIQLGLNHQLSLDDIKLYAKEEYSIELMGKIREILESQYLSKANKEQIINLLILQE